MEATSPSTSGWAWPLSFALLRPATVEAPLHVGSTADGKPDPGAASWTRKGKARAMDDDDMDDGFGHDETEGMLAEDANGGSSSDEDEDVVRDLIWGAQASPSPAPGPMDMIAHRTTDAVTKLKRAAGLGSSAACGTLGNLLSRTPTTRSNAPKQPQQQMSTSPVSPTSPQGLTFGAEQLRHIREKERRDGLVAANWFLKGLAIEVERPDLEDYARSEEYASYRKRRTTHHWEGEGEDEDEADLGESEQVFNLERALEHIIGITDAYRFGHLHPVAGDENGKAASEDELSADPGALSQKAETAVTTLLAHPTMAKSLARAPQHAATLPPGAVLSSPALSSSASGRQPGVPVSDSPSRKGRPPSVAPARSYTHPATPLIDHPSSLPSSQPARSLPASSHMSASRHAIHDAKLAMTIKVHVLYSLALHTWMLNKERAKHYWQEVVDVAPGRSVGTKEGDEIVRKARRRLAALNASTTAVKGDALESLDHIKRDPWGKHRDLPRRASTTATSDSLSSSTLGLGSNGHVRSDTSASTGSFDHPFPTPDVESADAGEFPLYNKSLAKRQQSLTASETERRGRREQRPVQIADFFVEEPKQETQASRRNVAAKFHFGGDEYPSPPSSEASMSRQSSLSRSKPASKGKQHNSTLSDSAGDISQGTDTTQKTSPTVSEKEKQQEKISRRKSIISVQSTQSNFEPPSLVRIKSSASVSTLPPDFFSSKPSGMRVPSQGSYNPLSASLSGGQHVAHGAMSHHAWRREGLHHLTSADLGAGQPSPAAPPGAAKAAGSLTTWPSFANLRARTISAGANAASSDSLRIVSTIRSTLRSSLAGGAYRTSKAPDVTKTLQKILDRDDDQVGVEMVWGGDSELESDGDDLGGEWEQQQQQVDEDEVPPAGPSSKRVVSEQVSSLSVRPSLRQQRSFIDVTSTEKERPTRPSNLRKLTPVVRTTPPTPDKRDNLKLATDDSKLAVDDPKGKKKAKTGGNGDIDPFLLALEAASRVGVKTKCAACGKKGVNFPKCPRCERTFCTRECRISEGKGGDGVRHVCAP